MNGMPSCRACSTSSPRAASQAATAASSQPLVDTLRGSDPFLVLADYQAYVDCQDAGERAWRDPEAWTRMSILNAARMGKFSSDRSIREYCELVWKVKPVSVS